LIRAVELLVSQGFNEDDVVHKFSLRKINAYVKAAHANIKKNAGLMSEAVRAGSLASDEGYHKWQMKISQL
jgi:hypothetical protein